MLAVIAARFVQADPRLSTVEYSTTMLEQATSPNSNKINDLKKGVATIEGQFTIANKNRSTGKKVEGDACNRLAKA